MNKFYLFILLSVLAPKVGSAQGIVNNGANIVITNTSNIYIDGTSGHYTSQNEGIFKNASGGGTINLLGNWINKSSNTGFSNLGSTVILSSASAQSIEGTNPSTFYNLTALNGGTKTVNTASSIYHLLDVKDNTVLHSNNSSLILLADQNFNANVAPLLNGAQVTGHVKVQSYFTGGSLSHRNSKGISPPINESGLSNNIYKQLQNYVLITGVTGTQGGFDLGGTVQPKAVTLTRYNEPASVNQAQFTNVQNIGDALTPGQGAFLYYRGDRSNSSTKLNAPYAIPESQIIQYEGPINQGDITVNLSYTNNQNTYVTLHDSTYNGFNLIGNPYPAVIDWRNVTKSNVYDEIKVLKPAGGFATYKNGETANAPGTNPDLRIIQPGQAFYVRAKGTGASVTFSENSKAPESEPVRLLYNSKNDQLLTGFDNIKINTVKATSSSRRIRMNLKDDSNKEEAVVVFNNGYSAKGTNEDAIFFGGSTVSLSSLSSDNTKLTINFMPEISSVQELKLSLTAAASSAVKLNFTDLSAAQGYQVYLKDNHLKTVTEVDLDQEVSLTIDKNVSTSFGDNRLSLVFTPITTLPVKLSEFKVQKSAQGALLSWISSSENNFESYGVEHTTDGSNFLTIGTVNAKGASSVNTSYSYLDKQPVAGQNYYRLKQLDKDGKYTYSKTVTLNYTIDGEVAFSLYPNPTSDKITIDNVDRTNPLKLVVIDLSGRELKSGNFNKTQLLQLNVADLQAGVYIIQVIDSSTNQSIGKAKFIKK